MNGPLDRLRRLLTRADQEVSISRHSLRRCLQCVDEWNENYFDDDWCDSARGIDCKSYIDWFAEHHR